MWARKYILTLGFSLNNSFELWNKNNEPHAMTSHESYSFGLILFSPLYLERITKYNRFDIVHHIRIQYVGLATYYVSYMISGEIIIGYSKKWKFTVTCRIAVAHGEKEHWKAFFGISFTMASLNIHKNIIRRNSSLLYFYLKLKIDNR